MQVPLSSPSFGNGHLDLGGVVPSHYQGEILYTPITEEKYYAVDVQDFKVGQYSVMPNYSDRRYIYFNKKLQKLTQPQPQVIS